MLLLLIVVFAFLFRDSTALTRDLGGDGKSDKSAEYSPENPKLDFSDRDPSKSGGNEPIALVLFRAAYTPTDGTYLFRAQVNAGFGGAGRAVPDGADLDVPTRFPTGTVEIPGASLSADLSSEVDMTIAMRVKLPTPFGLIRPESMAPETNPDPKSFVQVYSVRSRASRVDKQRETDKALLRAKAGDPSWSETVRQHYTTGPSDPRYKELAVRILAEQTAKLKVPPEIAKTPFAQAIMLREWVKENTVYNLKPGNGGDADPVADYLFGSHKGFCVHFATALTHLLRSEGIPARVAGGFAVPLERRGQGSSMLLQRSDGHAWCEVHFEGFGWMPFDGYSKRSESTMPPPPSDELKGFLQDRFEEKRNEQHAAPTPQDDDDATRPPLALLFLQAAAAIFAVTILTLLLALYSVKVWRRLAPRFARDRSLYRVCYRATLDRLADVGKVRQQDETREQFAGRLRSFAPELETLTLQHLRAAMGATVSLDRAGWRTLEEQIGRRLSAGVSRRERLLGLLNPLSWMRTR